MKCLQCCLLSIFYIKPQRFSRWYFWSFRCLLSIFYIKPQRCSNSVTSKCCCLLSIFYIKPQLICYKLVKAVSCLLSIFYIKPQPLAILYRYFQEVTSFLRLTKWTPNYLRSVFDAIFSILPTTNIVKFHANIKRTLKKF